MFTIGLDMSSIHYIWNHTVATQHYKCNVQLYYGTVGDIVDFTI